MIFSLEELETIRDALSAGLNFEGDVYGALHNDVNDVLEEVEYQIQELLQKRGSK